MPKAQKVPKESNSTKSTESEKGEKRGHKTINVKEDKGKEENKLKYLRVAEMSHANKSGLGNI